MAAGARLADHPSRSGLTRDTKAGPVWTGEVRFNEQWLTQPLSWRRPRDVFVCAHGDLFHEDVPDAWIDRVFAVMALAPQHRFQLLTKRAKRMREYLSGEDRQSRIAARGFFMDGGEFERRWPLPNVWLGVSVEDQARADERIPELLATPAAVRWVSAEPLLGAIEFDPYLHGWNSGGVGLDWIAVGGEGITGIYSGTMPGEEESYELISQGANGITVLNLGTSQTADTRKVRVKAYWGLKLGSDYGIAALDEITN
jgi:protein gp37